MQWCKCICLFAVVLIAEEVIVTVMAVIVNEIPIFIIFKVTSITLLQ